MFGPEEIYELIGDVGSAIFPCGYTILHDKDTIHFYYGAADSTICLATASIKGMLKWLEKHGNDLTGVAGQPAERIQLSPA